MYARTLLIVAGKTKIGERLLPQCCLGSSASVLSVGPSRRSILFAFAEHFRLVKTDFRNVQCRGVGVDNCKYTVTM